MSRDDHEHQMNELLGEGPSRPRSTLVKPVVDETWMQVEELPEDDDSEYTDEEVCICLRLKDSVISLTITLISGRIHSHGSRTRLSERHP